MNIDMNRTMQETMRLMQAGDLGGGATGTSVGVTVQ